MERDVIYLLTEDQKDAIESLTNRGGNLLNRLNKIDKNKFYYKFYLTDDQIKMFNSLLGSEPIPVEELWPRKGDIYYAVDGCDITTYMYDDDMCDKNLMAIGNFFKTRKEAEFTIEKLKVIAEMKKFAESKDRAWDGKNKHWYILTSDMSEPHIDVGIDFVLCSKIHNIYFESLEKADECLKSVGKDRIKKYYLEITEENKK